MNTEVVYFNNSREHQERNAMNHHEKHRKERERKIEAHKHLVPDKEKSDLISIHPKWLFFVGCILTLLAILAWSLYSYL